MSGDLERLAAALARLAAAWARKNPPHKTTPAAISNRAGVASSNRSGRRSRGS